MIMKSQRLKDCFGEETMINYTLTKPADSSLLEMIKKNYTVELFNEFPKPFFRSNNFGRFMLTGVLGLDLIKVTYRKDCPLTEKKSLEDIFNSFNKRGN